MASIREKFEIPGKMKTWSLALIGVGLVAFDDRPCNKRLQLR
jgi:hypothetical protein